MAKAAKARLDVVLTERGLVESRAKAQALVLAGAVRVAGARVLKPGEMIQADSAVDVDRAEDEFVGRGAGKLLAALKRFDIAVEGRTALDVGASTGGFTEVLLRGGATRVYALDVGYGQLAWRLRTDPRVTVMERTNIRHLTELPEPVSLASVDVSFISLRLVLPVLSRILTPSAGVITLIKPQFEAGKEAVGRTGVVRSPAVHRQVLERVLEHAVSEGWGVRGVMPSPVIGPAGNREFLAHLERPATVLALEPQIEAAMEEAAAG